MDNLDEERISLKSRGSRLKGGFNGGLIMD